MSIWIYITWLLLICVEIFRNWSIIIVKNRRPTYWWSNVIRIVVGFIFWVAVGPLTRPAPDKYNAIPIMMLFSFWFVFDYGLNLARRKSPVYYLNPKGSWIDRMQCKYPDALPWFIWKFFLMVAAISLCEMGFNRIEF